MDAVSILEQIAGEANPSKREAMLAGVMSDLVEALASVHQTVSWGDRMLTLDKAAAFLDEPRFASALAAISGRHRYDQYDGQQGIAWRINTLVWAARRALAIGGDFVECGVFHGDMSWAVAMAIGPENFPDFWLFDSVAGFSPELSGSADFPDNPGFHEFANRVYQVPGLYEAVRDRFAPWPRFKVVRGFLPAALEGGAPARIGYLHVDLNSGPAEIAVLERLFERVVVGGTIVFDDYGWKMFRGQREAEDAFMRARGHDILELPTGQGLVIRR